MATARLATELLTSVLTETCDLDAATDGDSCPEGGGLCCDATVLSCASLLSPMYIPDGGYIWLALFSGVETDCFFSTLLTGRLCWR